MQVDCLNDEGREFHIVGPLTANDLSKNDFLFEKGIFNSIVFSEEVVDRDGRRKGAKHNKLVRYNGARLFKHLKTSSAILYEYVVVLEANGDRKAPLLNYPTASYLAQALRHNSGHVEAFSSHLMIHHKARNYNNPIDLALDWRREVDTYH